MVKNEFSSEKEIDRQLQTFDNLEDSRAYLSTVRYPVGEVEYIDLDKPTIPTLSVSEWEERVEKCLLFHGIKKENN